MDRKSKISPNSTYAFDDDDAEELDAFSISTILDESELEMAPGDDDTVSGLGNLDEQAGAATDPAPDREPTIDELIDGSYAQNSALDETQTDLDNAVTGTHAALEVLLPAELLFPKDDDS